MISRWRHALIFSILLLPATAHASDVIGEVTYTGMRIVPLRELERGALLEGAVYSDSVLERELVRIDSLCFSYGLLAAAVTVDTFAADRGVAIAIGISEGEPATIGNLSVGGVKSIDPDEAARILRVGEGRIFDPVAVEDGLLSLLGRYNNEGFPYAQIWLTGFTYDHGTNEVDLSYSIFEGERAEIGRIVFEGLSRTDTSLALATSRLKEGTVYNEEAVERAVERLKAAPWFTSVGDVSIQRRREGSIDIVIPVEEPERTNFFQGAAGFTRDERGDYILSGAVDVQLRNIAGSGRDFMFKWLNDGKGYSTAGLKFSEPFLFSLPMHLEAEVTQIIQDTLYTFHSGGLYLRFPLAPRLSILAGAAGDRNIPATGSVTKSSRQRYRLGFDWMGSSYRYLMFHMEGAYRKNYLAGDSTATSGQLLASFNTAYLFPLIANHSFFLRLVGQGIFSADEILSAEMYPLGGAGSLRGYRENQFRGERVAYANFEYWFGTEGRLFLFDDIGAYFHDDSGWTVKNGLGFGLRAPSPVGTVILSFAVGDRLSLEHTRIHIMLLQRF